MDHSFWAGFARPFVVFILFLSARAVLLLLRYAIAQGRLALKR
jgi:hypothetical protein